MDWWKLLFLSLRSLCATIIVKNLCKWRVMNYSIVSYLYIWNTFQHSKNNIDKTMFALTTGNFSTHPFIHSKGFCFPSSPIVMQNQSGVEFKNKKLLFFNQNKFKTLIKIQNTDKVFGTWNGKLDSLLEFIEGIDCFESWFECSASRFSQTTHFWLINKNSVFMGIMFVLYWFAKIK